MGQYGTDAVGRCSPTVPAVPEPHAKNIACSSHLTETLRHIMSLSAAASHMANVCQETHARLYERDLKLAQGAPTISTGSMTLPLAMLLPVSGIASFAAGHRLAKYKQGQHVEKNPDAEALVG